jgi:hypothetical protein
VIHGTLESHQPGGLNRIWMQVFRGITTIS